MIKRVYATLGEAFGRGVPGVPGGAQYPRPPLPLVPGPPPPSAAVPIPRPQEVPPPPPEKEIPQLLTAPLVSKFRIMKPSTPAAAAPVLKPLPAPLQSFALRPVNSASPAQASSSSTRQSTPSSPNVSASKVVTPATSPKVPSHSSSHPTLGRPPVPPAPSLPQTPPSHPPPASSPEPPGLEEVDRKFKDSNGTTLWVTRVTRAQYALSLPPGTFPVDSNGQAIVPTDDVTNAKVASFLAKKLKKEKKRADKAAAAEAARAQASASTSGSGT